MTRTPHSTSRTLAAIGAFLALAAGLSALAAVLHEPPPIEAARGKSRLLRRLPPEELQGLACDAASTDVERLACLIALRNRSWEGEEKRDAAVVAALVETARRTPLPELREDVLRQLSGVTEPSLLPYLVECLEGDPSEGVRSEALETLAVYLALEGTAEAERALLALRAAADGDPASRIRGEASRYLP